MNRSEFRSIDFASLGISEKPVHLVIADNASRVRFDHVVCHCVGASIPRGSFVKLTDTAYVSSVDFLFLQKASEYTVSRLVLLGMELCGTYALDETDPRGFRDREPLTSVSKLQRFVEKAGVMYGTKKARRALRFLVDGSASPMESIQAVLFFLPCSLGGHGVARGELNGRIEASVGGRPFPNNTFYRCDILWRAHRLVVEYESDMCHTDPDRISADSKRRTSLIAAGYTVVTITKKQLFDAREFEKIANLLIRHTGKHVRKQPYNILTRRHALRKELFATIPKAKGQNPCAPPDHVEPSDGNDADRDPQNVESHT
ncbi:hypothetical protein [Raoultibacter phocaeensis]|uniref:hypothetical protein n=1 Tax=Raoultibacter phocaeensis TaxID=2479841 RepID=UPI0011189378|nr:hypothetical protein [Raoultibacter phocaeensis]